MKKILLFFALLFLGAQITMAQPTTSAPTPPERSTPKVISIFSDAYINVAGTNFYPNWGQATQHNEIEVVPGDWVIEYSNLNYQGIALQGSVNAISMTHLHLDVWSADETNFQITPISSDPTKEFLVAKPITLNKWTSLDIPLSEFTDVDFTKIFQFKIVGSGGKTVYIDNLYFYDETTTVDTEAPTNFTASVETTASDAVTLLLNATDNSGGVNYTISYGEEPTILTTAGVSGIQKSFTITGLTAETTYTFNISASDITGNTAVNNPITLTATTLPAIPSAPTPTYDVANVISIYSETYSVLEGTNFYPWWNQTTVVTEADLSGNKALKYSNFNYMGIELGSHIDASAMTHLHVDIYPTTETTIQLTPISPGNELPTSLGTLVPNQWNSIEIPLSTYTGVNLSDLFQFKFDGGTGGIFYMDNLFFVNKNATGVEIADDVKLEIYPNPAVDFINIKTNEKIATINISSILGQQVKTSTVNSPDCVLDISNLASGNYIITVISANGKSINKKFNKK